MENLTYISPNSSITKIILLPVYPLPKMKYRVFVPAFVFKLKTNCYRSDAQCSDNFVSKLSDKVTLVKISVHNVCQLKFIVTTNQDEVLVYARRYAVS